MSDEWWKKTVIYQIYPRSFLDTTGSGTGDLAGIISKLDYLEELGIETIWLSPIYPSPTDKPYHLHDCGYDISNYRDINGEYGDLEQFDSLVAEIHQRDMRIVMDLVLNHTSIEHPWFVESRSSRDNPKRDWYIWKEGKGKNGKKPPNNWSAMITGDAWKYDEKTHQFYYHEFLEFQPDLNYRNPAVQEEMLDSIKFWLKKGVDGFRLDIIHALFEDEQFRDEPYLIPFPFISKWGLIKSNKRQLHLPETIEFCKKIRETANKFGSKFLVGEVHGPADIQRKYFGNIDNGKNDGLNLVFYFNSLNTPLKKKKVKSLIKTAESWFADPLLPTWVFGNHDFPRRIFRLGNHIAKAKLNAALQLTLRGVPCIYYGEEIGMSNPTLDAKKSKDSVSHHFHWLPQPIRNLMRNYFGILINRDECRTPMQWNNNENAGFCSAEISPWLPVNKNFKTFNVEEQKSDPASLLNCYKCFLRLRKTTPVLQYGALQLVEHNNFPNSVLVYERYFSEEPEKCLILLNFSDQAECFSVPYQNCEFLASTLSGPKVIAEKNVTLDPWEAVILKVEEIIG